MNHAILIKPKTISQSFFTMSFTAPSFQFEYNYYPAILMSTSSRGVFNWTNGESSTVNTITGPLGSFHPTQMMLTKKLHAYGSFHHNYELIIRHTVENGVGQHNIYFVFFLQGRDDGPENALDLFLQKKTTIFDATAFLNPSFSERSNNVYYSTAKTKDHVFLFPKMILVKNEMLRNITGTPKPASQIYREILLSEHVSESNRIPIEYDKELIIDPVSTDILVSLAKPKIEGFGTTTQTCYPIDDNGKSYSQVVIGTGTIDGTKQVDALEDTQMIFGYVVLATFMFIIVVCVSNYATTMAVISDNLLIQIFICFLTIAFFVIGFSIPIAKLHQKQKEGRDKMHISTSSANLIGLIFLLSSFYMGFATLPFRFDSFEKAAPYLAGLSLQNKLKRKEDMNVMVRFFTVFFPFLAWEPESNPV